MRHRDQDFRIQRQPSVKEDQAATAYRRALQGMNGCFKHGSIHQRVGVHKHQHIALRRPRTRVPGCSHLSLMDRHDYRTTLLSYPGGLVRRGVIDNDRLVGNRERRRRLIQSQQRLA